MRMRTTVLSSRHRAAVCAPARGLLPNAMTELAPPPEIQPWDRLGWPLTFTVLRQFLNHWVAKRGDRPCPDEADLDPALIAAILPDLVIMDAADDPLDIGFRYVGRRVTDMYGQQLRGKRRRDLQLHLPDRIDQEAKRRLDNEFAWVTRSLNGAVRLADLRNVGRPQMRAARLTLPLTAVDGRARQLIAAIVRYEHADPTVPFVENGFAINGRTLQPMALPLDCAVRLV
jgi:hypothetical protein